MKKIFEVIGKTRSGKEVRAEIDRADWFFDVDVILFWSVDDIFDAYAVSAYVGTILRQRKQDAEANLTKYLSDQLRSELERLGVYNKLCSVGEVNQVNVSSYGETLAAEKYR